MSSLRGNYFFPAVTFLRTLCYTPQTKRQKFQEGLTKEKCLNMKRGQERTVGNEHNIYDKMQYIELYMVFKASDICLKIPR